MKCEILKKIFCRFFVLVEALGPPKRILNFFLQKSCPIFNVHFAVVIFERSVPFFKNSAQHIRYMNSTKAVCMIQENIS